MAAEKFNAEREEKGLGAKDGEEDYERKKKIEKIMKGEMDVGEDERREEKKTKKDKIDAAEFSEEDEEEIKKWSKKSDGDDNDDDDDDDDEIFAREIANDVCAYEPNFYQ